ncbi:hypothetical protein ZIOFF_005384 [Zingiber officinale]|uniref:Uncharacterized protein n=1 Tax=Zingiber officinale TaxID=94328 RepID=A0A8J5I9W1_ZINOF|nr:hypothetical protein ZIOFF_005384 [Zingiber officinale]
MAALQPEAAHSLQSSPPAASRPPEEPKDGKDDHPFFSWLSLAAFAFLTFNTAIAVRRSIDDPGALASRPTSTSSACSGGGGDAVAGGGDLVGYELCDNNGRLLCVFPA